MPDDQSTPIDIGRIKRLDRPGEVALPGDSAEPLGQAAAGMLRHLVFVLDREDRLESGTGDWLEELRGDGTAVTASVREAVLRAVHIATDSINFRILGELAQSGGVTRATLASRLGLAELSVSERVGDLVSAGLAVKVSEANQITGTAAGAALTEWVHSAVAAGTRTFTDGLA